MKKYILALFIITALLINLTGCGGSGSGNSAAGPENGGMATVRVNLNQDGTAVKDVEAVALYTPAAALREGVNSYENLSLGARAAVGPSNTDGVYKPASVNSDGTHEFNVPAGDYTLLASKGNTRAVLTGIRAASGDEPLLVTSLTPTGSVLGKVVDSASKAVAGAMVYLVDTSCVAFSGADGSFEMTGVPTNTAFKISAIYSADNKQLVAATEDVKVDSSLTATLKNNIVVKENTVKTMNITGSIVDTKGNGLASKAIMAMNGTIMSVGLSDNTGKFSIPVTVAGTYKVAALNAATPAAQTVTVSSSDVAVSENFVVAGAGKLASIKGKITLDTTRDTTNFSKAYIDSFLIRLVGSGTYYATTTKVNFDYNNLSNSGVTFDFTGIPAGKYGILVDPSANGFFGSVGNITVAEGQVLDISSSNPINVKYINPSFNISWRDTNSLSYDEYLPWMDTTDNTTIASHFNNAVLRCCRKEYNMLIGLPTPTITGGGATNVNALFDFTNDPTVASNTFDCVFSMYNTWSDPNTGLSGTLIAESRVLTHTVDGQLLDGDLSFVCFNNMPCRIVRDSDGGFTTIENHFARYFSTVEEILSDSPTKAFNLTSVDNMNNPHILGKRYQTTVYHDNQGYHAKIYTVNSENIVSDTPIKTIDMGDGITYNNDITYNHGCMAVDKSGNVYAALFSIDNVNANPPVFKYDIYKLSNNASEINEPVASFLVGACNNIPDIRRFNCLNDGRFYIETTVNQDSLYYSLIISGDTTEVSANSDRICCITDKYGYMYRLQKEFVGGAEYWYLIKVSSLDGKVLAKSNGYQINDLVDIAEDSNGNPVCYYIYNGY